MIQDQKDIYMVHGVESTCSVYLGQDCLLTQSALSALLTFWCSFKSLLLNVLCFLTTNFAFP